MEKPGNKKTLAQHTKPPMMHQVRIIGGIWKRTPLIVLNSAGLRPTPDRVRETVFNWLTHLLDDNWAGVRCLDLFGGTGALGFEAASRGATQVTMIEHNTSAVRQLEAAKSKLNAEQIQIQRTDALTWLGKTVASDCSRFNLIFLDPPYHQDWLSKTMPLCEKLLTNRGILYVESEFALTNATLPSWMHNWDVLRAGKAGMVYYHLLRKCHQCHEKSM